MTEYTLSHGFAVVFLACVVVVFLIDVLSDLGYQSALYFKWSLVWYLARYLGIVCGVLLALDVLF